MMSKPILSTALEYCDSVREVADDLEAAMGGAPSDGASTKDGFEFVLAVSAAVMHLRELADEYAKGFPQIVRSTEEISRTNSLGKLHST